MSRTTILGALAVGALTLAAAALGAGPDYGYGDAATTSSTSSPAVTTKETYAFKAVLNAKQETPKPKGAVHARGAFTAKIVESGSTRTFTWKLTFRNLTGKAAAAHVHLGKKGASGGVAVALCGPCRRGQSGKVKISSEVQEAMESGGAYVNVHTARNPGGEIRGQIVVKES